MNMKIWKCIIPTLIMMLLLLYGMNHINHLAGDRPVSISKAYLEDSSGLLTFDQILKAKTSRAFSANKSNYLTFGSSRSTWWIKLDTDYLSGDRSDFILSINNPSVQQVTAYIPLEGQPAYSIQQSGWGATSEKRSSVVSQTPGFEVLGQLDTKRPIYLRLQSVYPHNYDVQILSEAQFYSLRQQNLILVGLMLGTFATMALLNCSIYIFFRDKTYLYYAFYQLAMLGFQFVSMGVSNIFMNSFGRMLAQNQGVFSSAMFITSLLFVKPFLNTQKNTPKHHFAINLLMGILFLNSLIGLSGWQYETNILTDYLGFATAVLTLSVAILSVQKKIPQGRYFLLAWSILIIGGTIFILRNIGVLPNTILVQHSILVAATGEALIIFAALVDRSKVIWEEKQLALKRFHEADDKRKSAEISFLRAQIKPHFLYNTLTVIAALTTKNPPRAKELLYHLSDYLRGSFHFENQNGMTMLSDELETIRAYLTIEKERFKEKLAVEYDLEDGVNVSIPLLMIQPLVENALRHGIFQKSEGGLVRILVKRKNDAITVMVQDNGVGIPEERLREILNDGSEKKGVGLKNIHERMWLLYGYGLEIESREGIGTTVTLRIPTKEGVE